MSVQKDKETKLRGKIFVFRYVLTRKHPRNPIQSCLPAEFRNKLTGLGQWVKHLPCKCEDSQEWQYIFVASAPTVRREVEI